MQAGSAAMNTLNTNLSNIVKRLNDEFRLEYEPDQVFNVKPFNLVSPDLQTDDDVKRERYRVREFQNALHASYNGMNDFEVRIADALDSLGLKWCRNPAKTGYNILIPEIGEGTINFYPDFLLWTPKNTLWAIDPKGTHLVNDAIRTKLLGVSDVADLPTKIRVAFVLEGEYELGSDKRPQLRNKSGYSIITKQSTGIKAKNFLSVDLLVKEFLT